MRFAFLALACIILAAVSGYFAASQAVGRISASSAAKLQAHEFILVDEHGHIGAKLAWDHGQPQVQLFDRNDHLRSALFLEPNGVPDLYLYDNHNAVRAALNLFDSGVPNLAFLDESQKHMVLTEFDQQQSYNTVFQDIGKEALTNIAARKMTADRTGLHVLDTAGQASSR